MPRDYRSVQEAKLWDDEVSLIYALVAEDDKNSCDVCGDVGHKSNRCPFTHAEKKSKRVVIDAGS